MTTRLNKRHLLFTMLAALALLFGYAVLAASSGGLPANAADVITVPATDYEFTISKSGNYSANCTKGSATVASTGWLTDLIKNIDTACGNGKVKKLTFNTLDVGQETVVFSSGTYILTGKLSGSNSAGIIRLNSGATLYIIDGADISANNAPYVIYNTGSGSINITGGTVSSKGENLDAIHNASSGSINISGGKVENTASRTDARTIYNAGFSSNIVVSGGIVSANGGNALYGASNTNITITGGTVSTNSGCAINATSDGTIIINVTGGTVSAISGIAINSSNRGLITVSQDVGKTTLITSANNDSSSGTIRISGSVSANPTRLSMTGGKVENTANSESGRAVYNISAGMVEISGGTVAGVGFSYCIENEGTGSVTVSGGTVTTDSGYAIFHRSGAVNVSAGEVRSTKGSAIYNTNNGEVNVTGGVVSTDSGHGIDNNNSSWEGNGKVNISGGTVSSNTSSAINNNSIGTINIVGGTIKSTRSTAITNYSAGTITVSQDFGKTTLITSAGSSPTITLSNNIDTSVRLTINGGRVENTGTGSVISNSSAGAVDIKGGTLENTSSSNIILNVTGSINLSGGNIVLNSGYAIHTTSGSVNITGGVIERPIAASSNNQTVNIIYSSGSLTIGGVRTTGIQGASASFNYPSSFTYDGKAKTLSSVSFDFPGLTSSNYTTNYVDNINAGFGKFNANIGSFVVTLRFEIVKQSVAVGQPAYTGKTLGEGDSLPAIGGSTKGGSYELNAGQTLTYGTHSYDWTFIPDGSNNYNYTGSLTGKINLKVEQGRITSEFIDSVFLNAIRMQLGKTADDDIFASEVSNVSVLDVSNKGIASLAGIEYFTALEELICSGNRLSSLELNRLSSLLVLDCSRNFLSSLNMNGLTALQELNCSYNSISVLVVNMRSLLILKCSFNELESIDLSGLTSLETLHCNDNYLTSLSVVGLSSLLELICENNLLVSLTANAKLKYLFCANNLLESLNLIYSKGLRRLNCSNNRLDYLDLSGQMELESVECNNNLLSSLDLNGLVALVSLVCSNNRIVTLRLKGLINLEGIDCSNNRLLSLDLTDLPYLRYLFCQENILENIDVTGLTKLMFFNCQSNYLLKTSVQGFTKTWDGISFIFDTQKASPADPMSDLANGKEGLMYYGQLSATGMDLVWTVSTGALPNGLTLNKDGSISGTPTTTGMFVFEVRVSNPMGEVIGTFSITIDHDYIWTVTTDPTLEAEGELAGVCSYDDSHTTTVVLSRLNGIFYDITTLDPTCVAAGYICYTLIDKSYGNIRIEIELPALPHNYSLEWSYDSTGHWHECECGDKEDLAEHTGNWFEVTEATYTSEGIKQLDCEVCEKSIFDSIPIIPITDKFTDPNFLFAIYTALYNTLGKTRGTPIYLSEVETLTALNASNYNISSLAGIEFFTSLVSLGCSNNYLETLDVSMLTSLKTLNCFNNNLKTLNISGLSSLEWLNCTHNALESLDVSNMPLLVKLDCSYNYLADESAVIGFNGVWDGSKYIFSPQINQEAANSVIKKIDAIGQVTLTSGQVIASARASYELLTEIQKALVTNYALLQESEAIFAEINYEVTDKFTDPNFLAAIYGLLNKANGSPIYAGEIAVITYLNVSNKKISSLAGIECFTSLERLDCYNNNLKTLDVTMLSSLDRLDCYYNNLKTLDVSGLTSLSVLYCYNNQLETLNLYGLVSLWLLVCDDNNLNSIDLTGVASLEYFTCTNNNLKMLDVSELTFLIQLNCPNNYLESLDLLKLTNLTTLYCNDNNLTALDVSNCKIKYLDCSSNWIENESKVIGVSAWGGNFTFWPQKEIFSILSDSIRVGFVGVEYYGTLLANANSIWSVIDGSLPVGLTLSEDGKISGVPQSTGEFTFTVKAVSIHGEGEKTLAISIVVDRDITEEFTDPNFLAAVYAKIGKPVNIPIFLLDVSGITTMSISSNNISNLDGIQYFTSLESLICNSNKLTSVDLSMLTNLKYLSLYINNLTSIDVSALVKLQYLDVGKNNLSSLDVSGLINLKTLYCENNNLESLDVTGLPLMLLDCSQNYMASTIAVIGFLGDWGGSFVFAPQKSNQDAADVVISLIAAINEVTLSSEQAIIEAKEAYDALSLTQQALVTNYDVLQAAEADLAALKVDISDKITDSKFLEAIYELLGKKESDPLYAAELSWVISINLVDKDISRLDGIEYFINLQYLYCGSNNLTTLDISTLTSLLELDCSDNYLSSLDVTGLSNLVYIDCSRNCITTVPIGFEGIWDGEYYIFSPQHKKIELITVQEATCTEAKIEIYCCTECGAQVDDPLLSPALGHSLIENPDEQYLQSEASCTRLAVYYKSCSVCSHVDETETFEYGELEAHSPSDWIIDIPATETTEGSKHNECLICELVLETEIIPAIGVSHTHDFTNVWNFDESSHWHECSCGDKSEEAEHTSSDWIIDINATSTTEGSKHKECSICELVLETVIIPAIGVSHTHDFTNVWIIDESSHWHECSCGDKSEEAEHTSSDWIIDINATATTEGSKHKECSICGYFIETEVIPATGSNPNYTITDGLNGSWNNGTQNGYEFRVNGDFNKFTGVKIGGVLLSTDKYTSALGSTIITLNKEYLQTLAEGEYTIEILFTDGSVSTKLTITNTNTDTPPKDGLPAGAIVGIVIGSIIVLAISGFAVYWFVIKKKRFADLFEKKK